MHSPFHPLQIFLASVWACYRLHIENKLFLLCKSKMLCLCLFVALCWFLFVPSFPSKWGLLTSFQMICVWIEYLALNIDVSSRPCLALQAVLQLSCALLTATSFFLLLFRDIADRGCFQWATGQSADTLSIVSHAAVPTLYMTVQCCLKAALCSSWQTHFSWTLFPVWYFEFSCHAVMRAVTQAWC